MKAGAGRARFPVPVLREKPPRHWTAAILCGIVAEILCLSTKHIPETFMHVKAFVLPLLLLAIFALAGCNGKVAVINPDRVFQESNAVKSGMAHLEALSDELQDELVAAQEEVRKNRNQKNAQAALQARVNEAQQRYGDEQQEVMNQVNALYLRALEACRAKERIDVVITSEAALSYNAKIDITQKVIQEMNRNAISFSGPAAPQADAPKPAAK